MTRPNRYSLAVALLGGVGHAAALLVLFESLAYTAVEATPWLGVFALLAFVHGAVPALLSAHTRLLAPAGGLLVLFSIVAVADLQGAGDPNLLEMYVMSIFTGITVGLAVFVGVLEFAIRRGYRLWAGRLRNLPPLPRPESGRRIAVGSAMGLVGLPAAILGFLFGGPAAALFVGLLATAAAAVPLLAVLRSGALTPLVPFALVVPYVLYSHAFYMAEISGMGLFLLGPAAVLSALAWKVERAVRSRIGGGGGTAFADRSDCG